MILDSDTARVGVAATEDAQCISATDQKTK